MKVLVPITKAPDTTSKIQFKENNTKFDDENVQWILNPSDEWYALVRGLELKESFGGELTTVTVGGSEDEQSIRKAMALGADESVRVDAQARDAYYVAAQIAAYAQDKGFDIILTGKETIDHNGGQVGGMLAELLDMPYVANASSLQVEGDKASLEHPIPGGSQTVEGALPLVVSCAKGMAEQRIPNMRGIMAARKKQITVVEAQDVEERTGVSSFELPPPKSECKFVDAEKPEELIDLLHNEAKVI
ncbi:MAG: electron transfer flavoprotein beta subunit/FixA family protein [Flavobacteriales bacterium]